MNSTSGDTVEYGGRPALENTLPRNVASTFWNLAQACGNAMEQMPNGTESAGEIRTALERLSKAIIDSETYGDSKGYMANRHLKEIFERCQDVKALRREALNDASRPAPWENALQELEVGMSDMEEAIRSLPADCVGGKGEGIEDDFWGIRSIMMGRSHATEKPRAWKACAIRQGDGMLVRVELLNSPVLSDWVPTSLMEVGHGTFILASKTVDGTEGSSAHAGASTSKVSSFIWDNSLMGTSSAHQNDGNAGWTQHPIPGFCKELN